MLTAKQHELLLFIQRKLEETGISPSFEEMKEALDLKSKSGVHRLISALEAVKNRALADVFDSEPWHTMPVWTERFPDLLANARKRIEAAQQELGELREAAGRAAAAD